MNFVHLLYILSFIYENIQFILNFIGEKNTGKVAKLLLIILKFLKN